MFGSEKWSCTCNLLQFDFITLTWCVQCWGSQHTCMNRILGCSLCISSVDLLWHVLESRMLILMPTNQKTSPVAVSTSWKIRPTQPTVSCTGMTITKTEWTHWKTITLCSASSLLFFIGCPWSINEFLDCNSRGSCSRTRPYRSPRLLFMCMSWSESGKLGKLY